MQMSRPPPASHWSAQPLSALSLVIPAPRRPPIGYRFLAPEAGSRVRALRAAAAGPAAPFRLVENPRAAGAEPSAGPAPLGAAHACSSWGGGQGCVGTTRDTLGTLFSLNQRHPAGWSAGVCVQNQQFLCARTRGVQRPCTSLCTRTRLLGQRGGI